MTQKNMTQKDKTTHFARGYRKQLFSLLNDLPSNYSKMYSDFSAEEKKQLSKDAKAFYMNKELNTDKGRDKALQDYKKFVLEYLRKKGKGD